MKLSVTDSDLEIKFSAFEKILGMHGSFEIPLSHVKKASADFTVPSSPKDVKMPGTHLPGMIKAGTTLQKEERSSGIPHARNSSWFWS
ncbi:MAG: hypothetical protein J4F36_09515 [Nitrosopumilaceae archaeon]|nr:hypothetical protein [Nitrosopumilaceae archaeon]